MAKFVVLLLSLAASFAVADEDAGEEQPATYEAFPPPVVLQMPAVAVGEINCRYTSMPRKAVSSNTCQELADKYQISIDTFFQLNPPLRADCSNIQPDTEYCVSGFIEPLRAYDGKCGPPNNNATCIGVSMGQCCNSETWTCGRSDEDCAKGTCYEGICFGDRVYSTDGTCGAQHGDRQCAGKWGNCCHTNGTCGTGDAFCGVGRCQLGRCVEGRNEPAPPGAHGIVGNTTDGTCGGPQKLVCGYDDGSCCNKDGVCGTQAVDCGYGCQTQYGRCSSVFHSTVPSSSESTTPSATVTSL